MSNKKEKLLPKEKLQVYYSKATNATKQFSCDQGSPSSHPWSSDAESATLLVNSTHPAEISGYR